jgi:AraC-like DNA-binding protein
MTFWSTDTIPERERFSFWREIICNTIFSISPEAPNDHFSARVRVRGSGPLRFAICQSTSYEIIRTQRDIDRAPADYYTIYLQLQGQTYIKQCDDSAALHRNDIVLSDCRRPYSATLSNDGLRAVAVLPRPMVNSRAPWLSERPLHKIPSASRYIDLARRHMIQLMSDRISEGETDLLTENLCNLLALASAPGISQSRLRADLQTTAVLAFCRQNLNRPNLSPQLVADHFGISLRTLHGRFAKLGTTFGRWLLETRLETCSKALKDPQQHRYVSEIAYNCGFNDLSHFNKAFRARFEMAPTEWRDKFVKRQ